MHFGYSVDVKRLVPVPVEHNNDGRWTLYEIIEVIRTDTPPPADKPTLDTKSVGAPLVNRRPPPPLVLLPVGAGSPTRLLRSMRRAIS